MAGVSTKNPHLPHVLKTSPRQQPNGAVEDHHRRDKGNPAFIGPVGCPTNLAPARSSAQCNDTHVEQRTPRAQLGACPCQRKLSSRTFMSGSMFVDGRVDSSAFICTKI